MIQERLSGAHLDQSFEISTQFKGAVPTELLEALEGRTHLLSWVSGNNRTGTGADTLATLGTDGFVEMLEAAHRSELEQARDLAGKARDFDPEAAFLAHLLDRWPREEMYRAKLRYKIAKLDKGQWVILPLNAPTSSKAAIARRAIGDPMTKARATRRLKQLRAEAEAGVQFTPTVLADPAQALNAGDSLTIFGEDYTVVDGDGVKELADADGNTVTYLDALSEMVIDEGSIERGAEPDAQLPAKPDDDLPFAVKRDPVATANSLVSHFGLTNEPSEAGFILPDGRMLDLSGRHYSDEYNRRGERYVYTGKGRDFLAGQRNTDHRELPNEIAGQDGNDQLRSVEADGMLRVDIGRGQTMASPSVPMTDQQVRRVVQAHPPGDALYLDLYTPEGRRIGSLWLEHASRNGVKQRLDQANRILRGEEQAPNDDQVRFSVAGAGMNLTERQMLDPATRARAIEAGRREWLDKGYDSKYFKRWWKRSKVVGDDGRPVVVYHGTRVADMLGGGAFDTFRTDPDHTAGIAGAGAYFAENPEVANSFGQTGVVYPVVLSIQNPLDLDTWDSSLARALMLALGREASRTYQNSQALPLVKAKLRNVSGQVNRNEFDSLMRMMQAVSKAGGYNLMQALQPELMRRGYDGLTHTAGDQFGGVGAFDGVMGRVWVAYKPEQVKSVNNAGTFAENAPSMMFAVRDTGATGRQLGLLGEAFDGGSTGGQKSLFDTQREGKSELDREEERRQAQQTPKDGETGRLFAVRRDDDTLTGMTGEEGAGRSAQSPQPQERPIGDAEVDVAQLPTSELGRRLHMLAQQKRIPVAPRGETPARQPFSFWGKESPAAADELSSIIFRIETDRAYPEDYGAGLYIIRMYEALRERRDRIRPMIVANAMYNLAKGIQEPKTYFNPIAYNYETGDPDVDNNLRVSQREDIANRADRVINRIGSELAAGYIPTFNTLMEEANPQYGDPEAGGEFGDAVAAAVIRDAANRLVDDPSGFERAYQSQIERADEERRLAEQDQPSAEKDGGGIWSQFGSSNQPRPDQGGGMFAVAGVRLTRTDIDGLGLYSPLRRTIADLPGKADQRYTGQQMLGMLRKRPGIKPEELEWSGLLDYLSQQDRVTRTQMLEFLDQNAVMVEEVVKEEGGLTPDQVQVEWDRGEQGYVVFDGQDPIGDPYGTEAEADAAAQEYRENRGNFEDQQSTKYRDYQLPGGTNYREVLLTLPDKPLSRWEITENEDGEFDVVDDRGFVRFTGAERSEAEQYLSEENTLEPKRQGRGFTSNHWDEPNILAHVRLNDRTDAQGRKLLFVEEMQSDWHQAGRKKGYQIPQADSYRLDLRRQEIEAKGQEATPAERTEWASIKNELQRTAEGVPAAPFAKTWHELALKRVLAMASAQGYDAVAWTNGEQQAERYNLSKEVDQITVSPAGGAKEVSIELAGDRATSSIDLSVDARGTVTEATQADMQGKPLSEVVGKEIAERIMGMESGTLSGDGLKVGGSGMSGFYDNILVKAANKLGKSFGARVDESSIETKGYDLGDTQTVHALPITPELRQAAVSEGLPMFAVKGAADLLRQKLQESDKAALLAPAIGRAAVLVAGTASGSGITGGRRLQRHLDAWLAHVAPSMQAYGPHIYSRIRSILAEARGEDGAIDPVRFEQAARKALLPDPQVITDPAPIDIQDIIERATGVTASTGATITTSEAEALRERLRTIAETAARAADDQSKMAESASKAITELGLRGRLNPVQVKALTRRAARINFANRMSLELFLDYAAKVVENANHAADLQNAMRQQKRAARVAKQKNLPANYVEVLEGIALINVRMIKNPGAFAERVGRFMRTFLPKTHPKYATDSTVEMLGVLQGLQDEAEAAMTALHQKLIAEKAPGVDADEVASVLGAEDFDQAIGSLKEAKAAKLDAALTEVARDSQVALEGLWHPAGHTQEEVRIVQALLGVPVDQMNAEQKRRYITTVDNIIANDAFYGAARTEATALAVMGLDRAMEAAKESRLRQVISIGGRVGQIGQTTSSVSDMFRGIFGYGRAMAEVQVHMGHTALINGYQKAVTQIKDIANATDTFFSATSKRHQRMNTKQAIMAEGLAAFLIQPVEGFTDMESLDLRRQIVQQDIREKRRYRSTKAEAQVEADLLSLLDGTTPEIVIEHLAKHFPGNAEALHWYKDDLLPRYRDQLRTHDQLFENQADNYTNPRYLPIHFKPVPREQVESEQGVPGVSQHPVKPKIAANAIKRRVYVNLPPGRLIDLNLRGNVWRSLSESLTKANINPALERVRDFLKLPAAENLFGSPENLSFVTRRLNQLNDSRNRNLGRPDELNATLDAVANFYRKYSVSAALGGVFQLVKQAPDQVVVTLFNTNMRADQIGTAMIDVLNGEAAPLMDQYGIGRRGDIAGGTKFVTSIELANEKAAHALQSGNIARIREASSRLMDLWTYALRASDSLAAKAGWLAYYRRSLNEQGVEFQGWEAEARLHETDTRRQTAATYAETMVDITQVSSDASKMSQLAQRGKSGSENVLKAILLPYSSFRVQAFSRLVSDTRDLLSWRNPGPAARSLAGTLAGFAAFNAVKVWMLGPLTVGAAHLIMQAFDVEPPEDDPEKAREESEFKIKRFYSEMLRDTFAGALPNFAQDWFIDGLNFSAYYALATIGSKDVEDDDGAVIPWSSWQTQYKKLPFYRFRRFGDNTSDMLGMFSIAAERPGAVHEEVTEAIAASRRDDLTDRQKAMAYVSAVSEVLYTLRLNDADIYRIISRAKREWEKATKPE